MEAAALAAVIAGAAIVNAIRLIRKPQRSERDEEAAETREAQVERLTRSLSEALALLSEIEREIKAGEATARRLQNDIRDYEEIAELGREEAEAIQRLVRAGIQAELQEERRSNLRREIGIAASSTLAGAGISIGLAALFGLS